MKIEVLFPEFANLFGDCWNHRYLKACLPEAEFIETSYCSQPRFASEDVQLVYMGAMTESQQELVIKKLLPYKDRIQAMIDSGTVFLMTANAGEVFCDYIENEDGSRADALGIVPLHAKRDMLHRFNSVQLCSFENMELVGFKAEFSQLYGDNAGFGFAGVKYGVGINKESRLEGVRINNFFSTSMVGPFAVMNPLFVKYLMRLLGVEDPVLAHEEVIMAAYNKRLEDIKRMMNSK